MSAARDLEAAVADLLPRARLGDADALDALLGACRDTVYRWALVQTGDREDAEDVTQEVLIRLSGSLRRYEGRSRFTTWLYRVTRNQAANLGRSIRRRLRLAALVGRETPEGADPGDALPRIHAANVAALAAALLAALPRRQREVFQLADVEGCSADEIAERLGISPVTARVHVMQARRSLRSKILEQWPEMAEEAG